MSRQLTFILFFVAIFLQAGAYGLTFMLPKLFDNFGGSEKDVGAMLLITTLSTVITVYFSGHLSDVFGRMRTLGIACFAISGSMLLFGSATSTGPVLVVASLLLCSGRVLTYSLAQVVLVRLVSAENRVQLFALLSVFVMAGFGLAPVLAAALETTGYSVHAAFYLTSGVCMISAVLFLVLIAPIRLHAFNSSPEAASRITLNTLVAVLKSWALIPVIMVWLGASVFAGLNNFQTVFTDDQGLNYAMFFFVYTVTVVAFQLLLVKFKGGKNPYLTVAILQYVMCASVVLFIFSG